jgi:ribonuclease HI
MRFKCWTDGSTIMRAGQGEGPSGIGIVISDAEDDHILTIIGEYIGHTTNNYAEFYAVERCLETIIAITDDFNIQDDIRIMSDSKLVVETMGGDWQLKHDHLIEVQQRIERLELKIGLTPEYIWVKGHAGNPMNELADFLAYTVAEG